jgi:cytochrome P450
LFNEDLLHTVRTETEAAWKDQGLDRKHLCANSPTLDAMFHEALRLNGGAMVARKVLEPLKLGGKLLLKGHTVLIPSRQLHMNEQVWGSNVNEFDAARFAKDKSLTRHSSFRPFGGGVTYCPGRVLAKEEVFGFIAIFLHRFDLKLAKATATGQSQQKFPRLDDTIPALGISGPIKGMDIFVDLTVRS